MKTDIGKLGQVAIGSITWAAAMTAAVGQEAPAPPPTVAALKARLGALQTRVADGADKSFALGELVGQQYALAAAAGKVDWNEWTPLVAAMGRYLPGPAQVAVNKDLMLAMQRDIAKTPYPAIKGACDCLTGLGNQDGAGLLLRQWVTASDAYKAMPLASLTELVMALPQGDDGGAARRVSEAIVDRFFNDPQASGALDLAGWARIIVRAGPALPQGQRDRWAGKWQEAYAQKDLSLDELERFAQAMEGLGQPDRSALVVSWMSKEKNNWKALGTDKMLQLAGWLGGAGPGALEWRGKIATHVAQTLLAAPEALASQGAALGGVLQTIAPNLSDEQKSQLRSKLREGFKAKAAMTPRDTQDAVDWLRMLGEANEEAFVAEWTLAQTAWQGWKAPELPWLVGRLGAATAPSKAARAKIATHVLTAFILPGEALAATPPAGVSGLVQTAVGDWTQAQRTQCLAALRKAFGAKAMPVADLQALETAFRPLGDAAFGAFVIDWVDSQPCWQQGSPADLGVLYQTLGNSEPARGARAKVAAQLTATVLANPPMIQAASAVSICQFARSISADIAPAARKQWAAALRAALAQERLGNAELAAVRDALQAMGDPKCDEFIAGWVASQPCWKDWPASPLAGLARQAGPARSTLAAHVMATTISQGAVLASTPPEVLAELVQAVSPDWTPAQRNQCAAEVRTAFAAKAASLESLRAFEGVLRPLGEGVFQGFLADWVSAQTAWQQFSQGDLNALYAMLQNVEAARPARAKVGSRISAMAIENAQTPQALAVGPLCQTARTIAPDLAPVAREQWAATLRTNFGKCPLTNADLATLRETLRALGDARFEEFIPAWAAAQGGWKDWPAQELADLTKSMASAPPAARAPVATRALATICLPETLAQTPPGTLANIVQAMAPEWTEAQRSQCLAALRSDSLARPMSLQTLRALEGVFRPLNEGSFLAFVGEWLTGQSLWQQWPAADLVAMYDLLKPSEALKGARTKLVAQLSANVLGNTASFQPTSLISLCQMARAVSPDLAPAAREQWIAALRSALGKAPLGNADLAAVKDTLQALGDAKAEEFIPAWVAGQGGWKDWPAEEVVGLMRGLAPAGPAKPARATVASHVLSAFAAPEAVGALSPATLNDLLQTAATEWTEAQRTGCLTALRSAFLPRPMSLATLRASEPAFRAMGDGAFLAFVGDWINAQQAWQQYSLTDLNGLYDLVKTSDSAKPARTKVVTQVTATMLGDAPSLQPAGLGSLCQTARSVAPDLAPAVREQWITTLRTAYANAPLANADLVTVRDTLQTLGDAKADEFIPAWVAAQASWKDWPVEELSNLTRTLGPGPAAKGARGAVAAHLAASFAQSDAIAAMPPATLASLLQALVPDWTEAQRAQGLAAMRAQLAPKPMSLQTLRSFEGAFNTLGDRAFLAFVGDWLNAQSAWQQFSPADLNALYDLLKASEAAKPARAKVAAQLTATSLGAGQGLPATALASLCQTARAIAPDLTPALREQWTAALRAAFVKVSLNNAELAGLRDALQALGDPKADEFIPAWLAAQTGWKDWPADELARLGRAMATPGGNDARRVLGEHVAAMLAQADVLAAMPPNTLGDLVGAVVQDWTGPQRTQCRNAMNATFGAKAMSLDALRAMETAFRPLGDLAYVSFVDAWVNTQTCWRQFSLADLTTIYGQLRGYEAAKASRGKLVAQMTAAILGNAQALQTTSMGSLSQTIRSMLPDTTPAVREQWTTTLRTTFAATPLGSNDLSALREAFQSLGDARFEEFISDWVAGQSCWHTWLPGDLSNLARLVGPTARTKSAREAIAAQATAKFLAADAPSSGGDWDAWRGLAVALGDELTADQRARWADKLRSLHQRD